ncbi:matrin 3-like 1.2 isoform X1 [Nothobranchius furzeri]|uniref:Matrin 3-like 1.1 n=1 Tax=Nothobranchius furzeri TaxID=105023 RepID=A0A1A7ZE81_NOTFU
MSQKADGGQKPFSVGRGLLGAPETLNFNMNEQHSGRPMGGMSSGVGMGGMEGPDGGAQISRRGGGSNLGSTMKLFASLGLSPSDLDALVKIPEEDISVETLPRILMQLKSRKGASGERGAGSSMSSDGVYRGGRDSWDSSLGQGSGDFGFSPRQDVFSSRGFGSSYGGTGDGHTERSFSELSRQTSYSGLSGGALQSDSIFMQRRMGSPSAGKVQDYFGVPPSMFPHVCALCDFDVHSTMEWNQHLNGLRHAENKRRLLEMYPEWEPGMPSSSSGGYWETPNLSAGLLGPPPISSGSTGGMSSSWGGGGRGPSGNPLGQNTMQSRVVVVKYERKPLSNKTLFAFTEPFGRLREHLVLKNKAFLEMNTHDEALDMVNYYNQNPASLYGKPVTFYLSKRLMVIEKDSRSSDRPMDRPLRDLKGHNSKVVFFSNLPREDEKKKELLTIAERFGVVEKHLFLTDQAFIQLGTVEDAEMLVKYYSVNPLTIRGRSIRLNVCTKYKTLNVSHRQEAKDGQGRKSSRTDSTSSAKTAMSKSKSKDEKEKQKQQEEEEGEKAKPGDKPAAEEEEEKDEEAACGVEDKGEDEKADKDPEEEEPGRAEAVEEEEEEKSEAPDGNDVTAGDVTKQAAESEGQTEAAETEASTEDHENKDEGNKAAEGCEAETDEIDQDFLENMGDFVTLDELGEDEGDSHEESEAFDNTRKGGMRVVNIGGFRRGYNFVHELLALAKPFGKVVKHLVLDLRPEAYIQFEKEEDAIAMAKFYNSNVTASVCGRPVRITHYRSHPTIQCGDSKVVYIGQIPNVKYSNEDILSLAEPYGKIRKYFLHRLRRECFVEMDRVEDAEKMAEACKEKPLKFRGKRLTTYVSRKYKQLKHGHLCPTKIKRASSSSPPKSSQPTEEPPAKKQKVEEPKVEEEEPNVERKEEEEPKEEIKEVENSDNKEENSSEKPLEDSEEKKNSKDENQENQQEDMDTSTDQNGQNEATTTPDIKPRLASLPLPPYDPDTPIGVEHVKMGYYCRVCFLFYSNEDTAKKNHCSSRVHYDKLQKHLEKEQTKAGKKVKKTV